MSCLQKRESPSKPLCAEMAESWIFVRFISHPFMHTCFIKESRIAAAFYCLRLKNTVSSMYWTTMMPVGWWNDQCPVDYVLTKSQGCYSPGVKQYRWRAYLSDESKLLWYSVLIGIENKAFIRSIPLYTKGRASVDLLWQRHHIWKSNCNWSATTWVNLRESIVFL